MTTPLPLSPYAGQMVQAFSPEATPQPPHYIGRGPYAALIAQVDPSGYVHVKVFMPQVTQPLDWGPIAHKSQAEPGARYWQMPGEPQ